MATGRIQSIIENILAGGDAFSLKELRRRAKEVEPMRSDNFTRSVKVMLREGRIVRESTGPGEDGDEHFVYRKSSSRGDVQAVAEASPSTLRLARAVLVPPRQSVKATGAGAGPTENTILAGHVDRTWARHYAGLARAFLSLSNGRPLTFDELFPPRSMGTRRAREVLEQLIKDHLVRSRDIGSHVVYEIDSRSSFRAAWEDEKVFCRLLGREIPDEWSDYVAALMEDGRNEQGQQNGAGLLTCAAASVYLYDAIGQENTHRRTGVALGRLGDLRLFAQLPSEVQEAFFFSGEPLSTVRRLPDLTTMDADAAVALFHRTIGLTTEDEDDDNPTLGELEQRQHSLVNDTRAASGEPSDRVLLESCVKLCMGTIELLERTASLLQGVNRKMDWLAKELGYGDDT